MALRACRSAGTAPVNPAGGARTARNRRRRQRRRLGGATGGIAHEFVQCAMDPFNHAGPLTGVPDRFSGLSLVVENRTTTTIYPQVGTYILVLPIAGTNLFWYRGGTQLTSIRAGQSAFDKTQAVYDGTTLGKQIARFRTIALAVKVKYIGAAYQAAGKFAVTRFTLYEQDRDIVNYKVAGQRNSVRFYRDVSLQESMIMSSPSSVMHSISEGVYASSVRLGAESWEWKDYDDSLISFSNYNDVVDDKGIISDTNIFTKSDSYGPIDEQWTGILISVLGQTQPISVEVRHCFEAQLEMTGDTGFQRSLMRSSPPHNEAALNAVANLQRSLPAAIPVSESMLTTAARHAGAAVGAFAGGAASQLSSIIAPMARLAIAQTPAAAPLRALGWL